MKFREVLLVVVLVLAGFVLFQVKTGKWSLDGDWVWLDDIGFAGQEASAAEERTIQAPLPPAIEILNDHGAVEVRGGDQDFVQMTFKKTVWRRKKEDAEALVAEVKHVLTATPDKLVLSTNRGELPRNRNVETSFILTVPRSISVTITNSYGPVLVDHVKEAKVRNRHGELQATNVEGLCDIETSYDDLEAEGIGGQCRIVNSHGDIRAGTIGGDLSATTSYSRIRVDGVGGKADLSGTSTDIEALRVKGPVTADSTYEKVVLGDVGPAKVTGHNMEVIAETVHGDLEIRTSYEPVRADGVEGGLIVDAHNATVTANGIDGPAISVKTSYENVTLTKFSGEATVVDRSGRVTLEPRDLKGAIDVRNENGNIDFLWPSGERARLEARSKGGSVSWGLAAKPDVDETNGVSLVKAFSSDLTAPLIFLSTTYDTIRIQEAPKKF
jgi:DUF4097 and DUF4098 domain-containing protein YvlB